MKWIELGAGIILGLIVVWGFLQAGADTRTPDEPDHASDEMAVTG